MHEAELREQICLIGQLMHRNGYIDGAGGNISARLNSEQILTTPSGLGKGFMIPDQLIIVDKNGNRIDSPTPVNQKLRPTSEMVMHLECYRQRSDIQGVVHAHPPTCVALTISGHNFSEYLIPEAVMLLGIVPTLPYSNPTSEENRAAIAEAIPNHDALILSFHGSLTVAKSVWDAYLRLENLEHAAKIIYMVTQLGGTKNHLSNEQIGKLITIRERLGLLHSNEREELGQLWLK